MVLSPAVLLIATLIPGHTKAFLHHPEALDRILDRLGLSGQPRPAVAGAASAKANCSGDDSRCLLLEADSAARLVFDPFGLEVPSYWQAPETIRA